MTAMTDNAQGTQGTQRAIAAWSFPSSGGSTVYEVLLYDDGVLSCNCPGWVYCRKGERGCKHTRSIEDRDIPIMVANGFSAAQYGGRDLNQITGLRPATLVEGPGDIEALEARRSVPPKRRIILED